MIVEPRAGGEISIRAYREADRSAVLAIDFDTGLLGSSMQPLLDRADLFTRSLARFIDRFADLCFVAVDGDRITGYAIASSGDVTRQQILDSAAGSLADLVRLPSLSAKDRRYVWSKWRFAARALSGPERRFRYPRGPRLHVNLLPGARGAGIGSRLLEALFADLRRRGARHVHANSYQSSRNDTAQFWRRHGFAEHARVRSRAWSEFVDEPVDLVCFVRML
jgi:GNAT superfamily N-acetyltransferase